MFEGWENVYLMIGSAAAGLIGLLFVVVTLTSNRDASRSSRGIALYMTPTTLHFALVLTLSAVAMAPKLSPTRVAVIFVLGSVAGLISAAKASIGIHGLSKSEDPPHWTDLWCYGVGPAAGDVALAAAALALWLRTDWACEVLAATLLAVLLVGIRNAWDLVTWMAPRRPSGSET